MNTDKGFTLIELIMVIVLISAGLAGLATLFGNANVGLSRGEDIQRAAQFAQECAERVIGARRDLGFTSTTINQNMCGATPDGFVRTLTLSATYTGTATTVCPNGATCRDATVSVNRGAGTLSQMTFMLVQYF